MTDPAAMRPSEDPGWTPSLRLIGLTFIPFVGPFIMRRRRQASESGLVQLRSTVLDLMVALPLLVVAFSFIDRWDAGDDRAAPYLVVGIGLLSVAGAWRVSVRHLPATSERELANMYRARMFIGVGIAEGAVLWAFLMTFLVSPSVWLIVLGSVFTFVAFWFVAPTRRNLARQQQQLREEGLSLDLVAALNNLPPAGWRSAASK